MSKRFVVVGGATAVAGLVIGASILYGPPPPVTGTGSNLPGNISAPGVNGPGSDDPNNLDLNANDFEYTTYQVDDRGRLRGMKLTAKRANLKPMGVTKLLTPRAVIRLGPQRAITITADRADMIMEDSQPREGAFSGNVVVTLAQAPEGVELILDPEHEDCETFVQQRIFLDDPPDPNDAINFSIEDDTIHTNGPVHVTSPQVDFYGIGLRLAYNTQRERIEKLLISEGRYLIFNPEADAPGFSAARIEQADDDAPPADQDQPPAPFQYYAAEFFDDVVVRDGEESELGGDRLTIDFSLGTEAVVPEPVLPDAPEGAALPGFLLLAGEQLAQATPQAALPVVKIPTQNADRSLFTHDPKRDIVVTWTGEMRVRPHPEKPGPLADEDDVRVTLTGPNAYAQTTRSGELERLETVRLEYLLSEERTTSAAGQGKPVRILSDALGGEITGRRLVVNPQDGTATILGPGELTYTNQDDGKELTLTWQNRLDLELFTEQTADAEAEQGEASGARSQTRILGVKTATFDGGVTARHTDFDLDADTLTIAFAKPDKAKKIENTPTAINASGDVSVHARGDDKDETFDINAQRLSIDLSLDKDGEPYASAIRAADQVAVRRPGSVLTCQRVSVELNPPSAAHADAEPGEASGPDLKDRFAQVRMILAVGDVRAKLDYEDRRIDLVADQMIADVARDRLTLAADRPGRPAELADIANDRMLTGQLVVMDDRAEALTITGPGSLATKINDPDDPDATIEQAFLNIRWSESMSFNNITGEAEFNGAVRSRSRRTADATELDCDKLAMLFSPDYEHDPARLLEDDGEDAHERQVRSAVATGNVKFTATAWDLNNPDKVTNRLLLKGPKATFANKPATTLGGTPIETLVVEGKGQMMLEDYRPPAKEKDKQARSMTGRGASLFSWDSQMVLDARKNTATLVDGVQMVHLPKDDDGKEGDPVQLSCNRLVADMTDTGGLGVWMSDDAPDAQVTTITADGNVELLQKKTRSMRGDHLLFDGPKNLVELWTDEGRDVVIQDLVRDNNALTNKVTWDLTTNRIEIDEFRGGVAPLD